MCLGKVAMSRQQQKIVFIGYVQGVGFRFAACRCAVGRDIAGYVKNLPDGRVECVVEGEPENIRDFIEVLTSTMSEYIQTWTKQESPYSGQFASFGIRY